MRMKFLAAAALLAVAACGSNGQPRSATSPATDTSPQRSQSPTVLSKALFAVATGLPGAQLVNSYPLPNSATIKIVDASGRVYAEASFVPPPAPTIGNAVPLLQSPVRTGGGAAFYADSTGAVHKLKPDGSTSVVATFPLTSAQQSLSYAVSPDGAHLIAIILSAPPLHDPPPQTLGDPIFQEGGHWTLKLETADSGGSTTTTFQRDFGTAYPTPTQIVGWDKNGPLATRNTYLGAQQALPSARFFGALIHLAPDGTHLDRIGGQDCTPVDELPDGTVLCIGADWSQFSVRSSSGAIQWQASVPSDMYYYGYWLSPDANAVAVRNLVITRTSVASAARQASGGESPLAALGWLDASTVVGANSTSGQLSVYQARGMIKIRDVGVSGIFEGVL
jgi:hypothetical protein